MGTPWEQTGHLSVRDPVSDWKEVLSSIQVHITSLLCFSSVVSFVLLSSSKNKCLGSTFSRRVEHPGYPLPSKVLYVWVSQPIPRSLFLSLNTMETESIPSPLTGLSTRSSSRLTTQISFVRSQGSSIRYWLSTSDTVWTCTCKVLYIPQWPRSVHLT